MSKSKIYPIAVVGGGSAGVMATLRSILNNDETILFPGTPKHKKKSRAFWVSKVENIPGHLEYKKGIVAPNKESLDWLEAGKFSEKFHWMKNRGVENITKNADGLFELEDNKGEKYLAQYVILATGVMDVQPTIDGEIKPIFPYANIQLAEYCLRCDGHHILDKHTGIIGHDSGAAWVSIMLYERYQTPSMTIYTNGETPNIDERPMELLEKYGIKIVTDKIKTIEGPHKEHIMEGFRFENGELAKVEVCFVSLGMIVYNELAVALKAEVDNRGFVVTDEKGHTSIDGLYVAGDLRAGIKKQIYTAWDSAVDSADRINGLLREQRRNS